MQLQPWQWPIAILGALLIGLSKTGIPGVGIVPVAMFALIFPTTESVGLVLPLLICGDIIAVKSYHRHAQWQHLIRLFPFAIAGIVIGFFTASYLKNAVTTRLIGAVLVLMVAVHLYRKYFLKDEEIPRGPLFSGAMGLSAGFTTMVANAAGPIMVIYLLAMQLPKMEFIGTGAWYFFCLNSFKVPFQWKLGNITPHSLLLDGVLAPCVFLGTFAGRKMLPRLDQKLFETISLVFAVLAGLKLLLT